MPKPDCPVCGRGKNPRRWKSRRAAPRALRYIRYTTGEPGRPPTRG